MYVIKSSLNLEQVFKIQSTALLCFLIIEIKPLRGLIAFLSSKKRGNNKLFGIFQKLTFFFIISSDVTSLQGVAKLINLIENFSF